MSHPPCHAPAQSDHLAGKAVLAHGGLDECRALATPITYREAWMHAGKGRVTHRVGQRQERVSGLSDPVSHEVCWPTAGIAVGNPRQHASAGQEDDQRAARIACLEPRQAWETGTFADLLAGLQGRAQCINTPAD